MKKEVSECRSCISACKGNLVQSQQLKHLYASSQQLYLILKHLPVMGVYPHEPRLMLDSLKQLRAQRQQLPEYVRGTVLYDHLCEYEERIKHDLLLAFREQLDRVGGPPDMAQLKSVSAHNNKGLAFKYIHFLWGKAQTPIPDVLAQIQEAGQAQWAFDRLKVRPLEQLLEVHTSLKEGCVLLEASSQPGSFCLEQGMGEGAVIRSVLNYFTLLCLVHHILLNRWSLLVRKLALPSPYDFSPLLNKSYTLLEKELAELLKTERCRLLMYPLCEKMTYQSSRLLGQSLSARHSTSLSSPEHVHDTKFLASFEKELNLYARKMLLQLNFQQEIEFSEAEIKARLL
jgi:hypothetical protein